MVQENRLKKVVVITGPTAVGKTDISLKIAEYYKTEIINADASQFHKKLDVGTAKIDLTKTKIKHHLIDIIDTTEDFSIKDFQILGRKKIDELINKDLLPIIVGGSGLYISSLLGDYDLSSEGRKSDIEEKYKDLSNEELYNILIQKDFDASLLVHYNNRRRVLRYLEIIEEGNSVKNKNKGKELIYDALIIVLNTDRELLYKRIEKRVDLMLENGWIDEVQNLRKDNININKIKEIGYKEINSFLNHDITKEEMIEKIKKDSRHYAKRQLTWFKNKLNSHFIMMDYNDENRIINDIIHLIQDFYKGC